MRRKNGCWTWHCSDWHRWRMWANEIKWSDRLIIGRKCAENSRDWECNIDSSFRYIRLALPRSNVRKWKFRLKTFREVRSRRVDSDWGNHRGFSRPSNSVMNMSLSGWIRTLHGLYPIRILSRKTMRMAMKRKELPMLIELEPLTTSSVYLN